MCSRPRLLTTSSRVPSWLLLPWITSGLLPWVATRLLPRAWITARLLPRARVAARLLPGITTGRRSGSVASWGRLTISARRLAVSLWRRLPVASSRSGRGLAVASSRSGRGLTVASRWCLPWLSVSSLVGHLAKLTVIVYVYVYAYPHDVKIAYRLGAARASGRPAGYHARAHVT